MKMDLVEAQQKFLDILRNVNSEETRMKFLNWIAENWRADHTEIESREKNILKDVAAQIRSALPPSAILPSENIAAPLYGPFSDCQPANTIHVDDFLYDDEEVENLVESGKLPQYYCTNCTSQNVKRLKRGQYIFQALLPNLEGKTVIDIGSRVGAVLYCAHMFSSASRIIGVEMNREFCDLQKKIVQHFGFADRISIVHSNILDVPALVSSADVVILNNTFSFFNSAESCITAWQYLSQHLKVGCVVVTIPHLEATFAHLQVGFEWQSWVKELPIYNTEVQDITNWEDHMENVKHYQVIAVPNGVP